jgi:site-specific DNA-cytosine methylase
MTIETNTQSKVIIFYGNRVEDVRIQGGVINTLQARMGTGGNNMPMIAEPKTQVRRLTPIECERLQGFPDDWTAGQSDSQRYKQMGNAVAVPVVEWIIQNICDTI